MKKIIVVLGSLFIMAGSTCGEQAAPRDTKGTQFRQPGGSELSQQGGTRFGPPPEAFKACEGKTDGSTAQFTAPDGKTVRGTCRFDNGILVLRPDHPRGGDRDGRREPPPEAYKACEGKSTGSPAQFVNARGETVQGTCEEKDGKLVLRPDRRKGSRQGQDGTGEGRRDR